MSVTLGVSVESGRADRVSTEVLVAPFFGSDRPLRGPAAQADWRLCGWLSDELRAGRTQGRLGEAALLLSGGRLRARWLLALGLGPRPSFGARALRDATREGTLRLVGLRVASAVFALPPELVCGLAAPRAAEAWLQGTLEALERRPGALRLRLLVEPGEAGRVRSALVEAASRHPGPVVVRWLAASPSRPAGERAGADHAGSPEGLPAQNATRHPDPPSLP